MSLADLPEEITSLAAYHLCVRGVVALSASSRANRKRLLSALLNKTPCILHACLRNHHLFVRSLVRACATRPSFLVWPLIAACLRGSHLCAERILDSFSGSVVTCGIGFLDWFPTWNEGTNKEGKLTPATRDIMMIRSGDTALQHASKHGHDKCVSLLVEARHDVNESTMRGDFPLAAACRGSHFCCVRLLIEAGAWLERSDPYDRTPLMLSCDSSDLLSASALLEAGASPHTQSARSGGRTALYGACTAEHCPVGLISLLLDWGAVVDSPSSSLWPRPLFAAIHAEEPAAIARLVEGGADVNSRSPHGDTPLLFACSDGVAACIEALIAGGADVNATNAYGIAPLTRLAIHGNCDAIPALVRAGADIEVRAPDSGMTPLLSAIEYRKMETATVLLRNGANPLATCDGRVWRGMDTYALCFALGLALKR